MIVKRNGEVVTGDFRNDMFEGKQKYEKKMNQLEVDKYFMSAIRKHDAFIDANGGGTPYKKKI